MTSLINNFRRSFHTLSKTQFIPSYFNGVFDKVNEDIIFKTLNAFNNDESQNKVNLGIGIYANAEGVLPPVKSRYLSLSGDVNFLNMSQKFVFDQEYIPNMFKFQTCGGTGALSLAEQIISFNKTVPVKYGIPLPTWPNHIQIFKGEHIFKKSNSHEFIFKNRLTILSKPDVLVVQTSCHNPTGIEYTDTEKEQLLNYAENNNIVVVFDTAYLGLSGDFDNETKFLKDALKRDIDILIPLSYSKIADVYGHRTGVLFFRPKSKLQLKSGELNNVENNHYDIIKGNIEQLIRTNISNSPRHGSDIIMEQYFKNDEYIILFKQKIKEMAKRINVFREKFGNELEQNGIKNNVKIGKGMFSILPLSPQEIFRLQNKYHIYLLPSGRINICGLTNKNYDYVIESIVKNNAEFKNNKK